MKYFGYIILLLFVSLIFISFSNTNDLLLTYIESSQGLHTVQWEGGRTEIEFADINNDGFKDILSIGDHGNPYINTQEHGIMVYFGNGSGSNWNLFQFGTFGYGGIAIGDVNNDGKMDVGYGMHHNYSSNDLGDQILEVALGDGSGMNWTAWDDSLASQGETWGMFTTDFGDVDNDGLLDIGSISFGCCAGVHIYKNMGVGKWRQTFGFINGNSSMEFSFGDINNDGNLDFAAAHQYGTPYFGDGTGNFTLKHNNLPSPGNSGLKGTSLGDVNNDGAKDLAFIGTGGSVNVWKWNNTNQNWDNLSANLPSSSTFQTTVLYDMNSDGFCDLVLYGNASMVVYTGNGGTNWTSSASFSSPPNGSYQDIAVADADNNGFADIGLLANEGSGYNTYNVLRFYKETSAPVLLTVFPLFPRGGEWFKNGQVRFIEWISSDPPPAAKIKLELSTTGNGGPWTVIADSLPNNGRKQWIVPQGINSANCFIKYTAFEPGNTTTGMNQSPFWIGNVTGIEAQNEMPKDFVLYQNYPNPFNPMTTIKYEIPFDGYVTFVVYDIIGKEIINKDGYMKAGKYEYQFDGSYLASGVYFYSLKINDYFETRKMLLIK